MHACTGNLSLCAKQSKMGMVVQVSGRIWEHALTSLHALKEPSALIAWLPSDQPDGKAGAAAALLGNLAQVSASALQVKSCLSTCCHPCTAGQGLPVYLSPPQHCTWQSCTPLSSWAVLQCSQQPCMPSGQVMHVCSSCLSLLQSVKRRLCAVHTE